MSMFNQYEVIFILFFLKGEYIVGLTVSIEFDLQWCYAGEGNLLQDIWIRTSSCRNYAEMHVILFSEGNNVQPISPIKSTYLLH